MGDRRSLEGLRSLAGKTAVVTGAAQGFGYAIAERLAEAGAAVAIADRNPAGASAAADRIRAALPDPRVLAAETDVTDPQSVDRMLTVVEAEFGPADILVNNAGVYSNYMFLQLPLDEFDRVQRVNVRGAFICSQAVARSMALDGRGGVIIHIASVDALGSSAEGLGHYTTSKHAIAGMTKSMAMELGPLGIRVAAVCPGAAWTEGTHALLAQGAPAGIDVHEQWRGIVARTPLGRLIDPDEIGVAAAVVASDLMRSVHGVLVVVDGGIVVQPLEGYVHADPAATARWRDDEEGPYRKRSLADLISLRGRRALVTGGGQGFGDAIAERLAEAGAEVAVVDREPGRAERAVERIQAAVPGARAAAYAGDVSTQPAVEALFDEVERSGPVEILVNNVGGGSNYLFHNIPADEFERVLRNNVVATFLCSRRLAAGALASGRRDTAIVNIGSVDALSCSAEGLLHYSAAKHGVAGLTKAMAMELGPHGIRVNTVCPGAAWTEGVYEFIAAGAPGGIDLEGQWEQIVAHTPLGRLIEPDEIGVAAAVLASDLCQSVHGTLLVVDGGILVQPLEGYVPAAGSTSG